MADRNFKSETETTKSFAIVLDGDFNDVSDGTTIVFTETATDMGSTLTKTVSNTTADDLLAMGYAEISSYDYEHNMLKVGFRPISWVH
jgi:hypothetical protein